MNCHKCGKPLDHATATVTFSDFELPAMNGMQFRVHARCLPDLFKPDSRSIDLPVRVEEGADELVAVEQWGDWLAICREHGTVGIKDVEDDAHLAAANHIFLVHSGLV